MVNNVKEILDNLIRYNDEDDKMKWSPEDILTIEDVWLLLDYITNLQEQINYWKTEHSLLAYKYKELQKENKKLRKELKEVKK